MSIVLCCPTHRLFPRHIDHLQCFMGVNALKHQIIPFPDRWFKALHHVQRGSVSYAQKLGASHVLFTEDDQWGYPADGLDHLLKEGKDVIGFKSYFKEYPYKPLCARKKFANGNLIEDPDPKNLVDFVEQGGGPAIQQVDLITWAFTLVRVSVFDRMGHAGLDPFRQWGPHPTDSFFCQYCADLGIPIFVDFGFTIGHGDVQPDEIVYARRNYEMTQLQKGRLLQPGPQIMRDDRGMPLGWTVNEPEVGKMVQPTLDEPDGEPVMYTPEEGAVI